jgi:hypothetical protein
MALRALAAATTLLLVLFTSAAVARYLSTRGDWPGWDEGWALVLLPLGVPLAVALGLLMSGRRTLTLRATVLVSVAVWGWGAVLFLAWLLLDG